MYHSHKNKTKKQSPNSNDICKVCQKGVTKNTGLRCRGPCSKWIHFECLSFSPEKVKQFQNGAITMNCPCPGCDPNAKEEKADEGYTCMNKDCIANQPLNPDGTQKEPTPSSEDGKWPKEKCGNHCKNFKADRPIPPSCEACGTKRAKKYKKSSELNVDAIEEICKKVRVLTKEIDEVVVNMKNKQVNDNK